MDDLDPREVVGEVLRRKRLWTSLVAAVFMVLLCAATFWGIKWAEAKGVLNGDFWVVEAVYKITEEGPVYCGGSVPQSIWDQLNKQTELENEGGMP